MKRNAPKYLLVEWRRRSETPLPDPINQETMKNSLLLLAIGLVAGGLLVGCSNTAEGVKEDSAQVANDTANAGKAVAQGAENAVNATANAVDNTGKAVAQGAAEAANTVANAADNTGKALAQGASAAANVASNAGEAAANSMVTGKVKLAIAADDQLHGKGNTINVDTLIGGKVVLRGAVTSAELKKKAEMIAMKVIKDNNYKETVVNQLTVGGK